MRWDYIHIFFLGVPLEDKMCRETNPGMPLDPRPTLACSHIYRRWREDEMTLTPILQLFFWGCSLISRFLPCEIYEFCQSSLEKTWWTSIFSDEFLGISQTSPYPTRLHRAHIGCPWGKWIPTFEILKVTSVWWSRSHLQTGCKGFNIFLWLWFKIGNPILDIWWYLMLFDVIWWYLMIFDDIWIYKYP